MAGYVLHALSLHLIQDFDNTRIICALVLRLKQHNIRMIPGYADIRYFRRIDLIALAFSAQITRADILRDRVCASRCRTLGLNIQCTTIVLF